MPNEPPGYLGIRDPAGSMEIPASFVIFKGKDGQYYASSMLEDVPDARPSADAATVIQGGINNAV